MGVNESGVEPLVLGLVLCASAALLNVLGCQDGDAGKPATLTHGAQPLTASDRSAGAQLQTQIVATFNHCPHVTFEATPVTTFVHGAIRVLSQSVDPEGDATTLVWSAEPDGTFVNPTWRMTEYRCGSAGTKTIMLQVRDAPGCRATGQVDVTCLAAQR